VRGVFDQVVHGAAEKHFIGYERCFALAANGELLFLGDRLVERGDFLDRGAAVERAALQMTLGSFGAGEKKQIVDDLAELVTLGDRRFDYLAVFLIGTRTRERDFGFAANVADRRAQFVGDVRGELRKADKRIFEPRQHVVEGNRQRLKFARPADGGDALVELLRPDTLQGARHFTKRTQAALRHAPRDDR